MNTLKELEARRRAILDEMCSIRSMRRGTINEQFLKVKSKSSGEDVVRGPYYVISRNENGRTVSERLRTPEELKRAQDDVNKRKKFAELCEEYAQITERMGELERTLPDESLGKKLRRLRSRRMRR